MNRKPKTLPQHAPYWKYNLANPTDAAERCVSTQFLNPPPNKIDSVLLEISRSSLRIRGNGIIAGIFSNALITLLLLFYLYSAIKSENNNDIGILLFCIAFFFGMYWFAIPIMRMDLEFPRDEPIRFNRERRKVYFYQYKFDRFWILSRRKWGIQPEVHDWDNLIAEACSVYAPGNGGLIENVMIAVKDPETQDIIARYFFSHDIEEGKKYWDLIRLYMQQGVQALPDFVHSPRDWNNDAEVSFMRRLAPKVQWPPEIDLESRTAPGSGETS